MRSIICIVGSDGAGKSMLAREVLSKLKDEGHGVELLWSRSNNYLSKPLLALARLTGQNYYRKVNGVRMGFHCFEKTWWLRWPYAFLQMIDVNIASRWILFKHRKRPGQILLFERSAWDTLSDVMGDTGLKTLSSHWIGRGIVSSLNGKSTVICIDRNKDLILASRPELAYDNKLNVKLSNYLQLAKAFGWHVIANNGSVEAAQSAILKIIQEKS